MHVDGSFLDEDMVAPNLVEELDAAMHALRMGHEEMQQAKFGRAEMNVARAAECSGLGSSFDASTWPILRIPNSRTMKKR